MFHALRAALEVVYGTKDLWVDMPRAGWAMLIFVSCIVFTYLFYVALTYTCLGKRWRPEKVLYRVKKDGGYDDLWLDRIYPSSWRNFRHVFVLGIIFLCIVASIWFAAATAGFNPWTSAAASICIGIVATYGFAMPLGLVSAGFTLSAENEIGEGQHWEFHGMGEGWDGRVVHVNMYNVEMERFNEQTQESELIVMPINYFLQNPRKRNWEKERAARMTIKPAPSVEPLLDLQREVGMAPLRAVVVDRQPRSGGGRKSVTKQRTGLYSV